MRNINAYNIIQYTYLQDSVHLRYRAWISRKRTRYLSCQLHLKNMCWYIWSIKITDTGIPIFYIHESYENTSTWNSASLEDCGQSQIWFLVAFSFLSHLFPPKTPLASENRVSGSIYLFSFACVRGGGGVMSPAVTRIGSDCILVERQ